MPLHRIEMESRVVDGVERDSNRAFQRCRQGHTSLIDVDDHAVLCYLCTASTELIKVSRTLERRCAALSHRPALTTLPEQHDIYRAMILGWSGASPPLPFVIG